FLRARNDRLLAADHVELVDCGIDDLRVRRRRAEAHVHDDLLETRNLHRVLVTKLLHERGHHFLLVDGEKPRRLELGGRDDLLLLLLRSFALLSGFLLGSHGYFAFFFFGSLASLASLAFAVGVPISSPLFASRRL